jgi:hypothetical protein
MELKKYLELTLIQDGYNGLTYERGECCCKVDDLMPCEGDISQCEPCVLTEIPEEDCDRWDNEVTYEIDYEPKEVKK